MTMFKGLLITSVIGLTAMTGQASAAIRHYSASVSDSKWELYANTRLQCGISHHIPRYGEVMFSSVASKQLNLEFEMDMLRLPANYSLASVKSIAPSWKP
ncbi:MAG: hypothetical protein ACI8WB_004822, partial [Phenylobacterium sp.]